jgi:hypothetical protein
MIYSLIWYAPLLMAVAQVVFCLLFFIFLRRASSARASMDAAVEIVAENNTKLDYIIRRQNTTGRLIMKSFEVLNKHDAKAMDFLDHMTKAYDEERATRKELNAARAPDAPEDPPRAPDAQS